MSHKEIAQHYVLEIVARARTVENKCTRVLDEEFFSQAPPIFARTVRRVARFMSKAVVAAYSEIDWTSDSIEADLTILRNADLVIMVLAEELRYIEGARTERIPWSIVPAFEKLVSSFLPDIQIMLRGMWRYNYSFHTNNQADLYRFYLREYAEYVPDTNIETDVLQEMQRPFHLISFPLLEQKHILLHCLLGHEIGHLLAADFITNEAEAKLIEKVKDQLEGLVDEQMAGFPSTAPDDLRRGVRERFLAQYIERFVIVWRRGMKELLSDAAAVLLFGPAALLAMLDLAMQEPMDSVPSEEGNYYPPWRMRLRYAYRILSDQGGWFPIPSQIFEGDVDRVERVNRRIAWIKDVVSGDADQKAIQSDAVAALSYEWIGQSMPVGIAYLLDERGLRDQRPSPDRMYGRLPILVERLDTKVPPNAIETTLGDSSTATFAEILNAAWFQKVARPAFDQDSDSFLPDAVDERNLMNNLTLKAIEFATLANDYASWTPPK